MHTHTHTQTASALRLPVIYIHLTHAARRSGTMKEIGAGMINKRIRGAAGRLRRDQVLPKALVIKRKIKAAWYKCKGERVDEKQWRQETFKVS